MEKQPNGFIPGIFAAFLILGIIFFAMVVKVFDSVSNSGNTPATSNSNRQNAPERPAATPDNFGNANRLYNSNMSSSSMNSNFNAPSMNSNMKSSEMNSNYGEKLMNSNMMNDRKPTNSSENMQSRYNGRVIRDAYVWATWEATDDYLEEVKTDDQIIVIKHNTQDKRMYYVETESGIKGWMNGNDFEYVKK